MAQPQTQFNVNNFGAIGDGIHLDTEAINKTIQAACEAGGGTVLLPAGKYLSGTVLLQSNVTVCNCLLNSSCNAIRTGGRNVLINNCLIYGPGQYVHRLGFRRNTESGFQVLPQGGRGGGFEAESSLAANKVVPSVSYK